MHTQFQVKEYSRKRQIMLWLFMFTLVLALMVGSYIAGSKALGFDSSDMNEMQSRVISLNEQVVELKKENRFLLDNTVQLKRDAEFNRAAEITAKEVLGEAQKELAESKQELIFFRSLLNPDGDTQKLSIHSFVLEPKASSDEGASGQTYRLVLTKFRDSMAYKRGRATLVFEFASGKTVQQKKAYKFKFFQRIYGEVPTSEGELPTQIVVKLYNKSGAFLLEKTYSWPNLIADLVSGSKSGLTADSTSNAVSGEE